MSSSIAIDLKTQIYNCLLGFSRQFPEQLEFVLAYRLVENMDPADVMNYGITKLLPFKTHIIEQDENFFLTELRENQYANNIMELWSAKLDSDDKELVWAWLESFICLIDKYLKTNK